VSKAPAAIKRLLLGRPMSSSELEHTLLPKFLALPVFSSDPLSSNAYATQEILLTLGAAGATALSLVMPISIAVAALLIVVVSSYRQTVRAYPTGGGAYRVSSENLGMYPGLLAASALLLDYVLTVAVSITAGVDAITSAAVSLEDYSVLLSVGFVAFVTLINLRGVKESGTFFAIPTYGFVLSIYLMLAMGFVKCIGGCPAAESAGADLDTHSALTWFLVLKAFAAGTTALTGVEAIADGVQAFRYPQSRNAAATLAVMAGLTTTMFLGISWLADHTKVVFTEHAERTVVAQIGHAVFGGGPLFYILQAMTAGILILAANTAYQDFPRLSSILAQDSFMPRQFMNRGDRLVFSNGVLILATLSSLLIIAFDAEVNKLIQLYLIGVFISFTLSQTGMVLRWRKIRNPGWRRRAVINGIGATVTGVVFWVIVTTKFIEGAWIVVVAIPIVMFLMRTVHKHYMDVREQLATPTRRPTDRRVGNQHMVILADKINAATARAIGYCRSIGAGDITAITFDPGVPAVWNRLASEIPIKVIEDGGANIGTLRKKLREKRESLESDDFLTIVIPEVLQSRNIAEIIRHPPRHRLKASLLGEEGVQVLDIPVVKTDLTPGADEAHEPARNFVVVMVSGVNNATLQAIEYAETLRPTSIRAVNFGLDPERSENIGDRWLEAGIPHPLEIEDSPFRDIGRSLRDYIRRFNADGVDRVVTVVLPEFVVEKRRHAVLHGQTALLVKRHLLFEQGVVAASVPYHLD
jgi:amino acid transporter